MLFKGHIYLRVALKALKKLPSHPGFFELQLFLHHVNAYSETQPHAASASNGPKSLVNTFTMLLSFWGWSSIFLLKHQGSRSSPPASEGKRFPSELHGPRSSCSVLNKEAEQGATLGPLTQLLNTISSKLKNPSWTDKSSQGKGGLRGSWRHK